MVGDTSCGEHQAAPKSGGGIQDCRGLITGDGRFVDGEVGVFAVTGAGVVGGRGGHTRSVLLNGIVFAALLPLAFAAATPCFMELMASCALVLTEVDALALAARAAAAVADALRMAAGREVAAGVFGAGALQEWSEGNLCDGQNCSLHASQRMGENNTFLQLPLAHSGDDFAFTRPVTTLHSC